MPQAVFAIPGMLVLVGIFEIFSCWTDQDFYFDLFYLQKKMRRLGREGTRRYYLMVGVARIITGVAFFIGLKYMEKSGLVFF